MKFMDKNLLKIAKNIKEFANIVEKANQKTKNIDVAEFINSNISTNQDNTYFDFFINKNFRMVFEGLYNQIKETSVNEIEEMLLFISLCAYNQDWDYVFETVKDYRGQTYYAWRNEKNEEILPFDVKNWGRFQPNYDTYFLNQIRNCLAHARFSYDENTKKVTLTKNNGEFVVEMPIDTLFMFPNQIWSISEKSTSKETRQSTILLKEGNYNNGVRLVIKNEKPQEKAWNNLFNNLGLNKDEINFINNVSNECLKGENVLTLVDKMQYVQKIFQTLSDKIETNKLDGLSIIKLIYEKFGLTIEKEEPFNLQSICDKDSYLELYFTNMLLRKDLSESDKNLITLRVLNIKKDELSKNFLSNNAVSVLLLNALGDSTFGKFRTNIKNTYIPLVLEDIGFFVDKAYFNYVFNYLVEKTRESGEDIKLTRELENISATDYFEDNDYTQDLSLDKTLYYIRNCVVHPRFLDRDGNNYILSDFNKKGELVFSAKVDRVKLFNLANLVIQSLNTDKSMEESLEEQTEPIK